MKRCCLLCLFLVVTTASVNAEDLDTIFTRVNELVAKGNYPKAIEELSWARKEIEKLSNKKLASFFPDDIAGFKGGKIESGGAMGFTSFERSYNNPANKQKLKISIAGSSKDSGIPGFGGLAQLGQMAAMMGGGAPGQETVRISGRTAMLEQQEGSSNADLSIFLDSGSILKLELSGSKDSNEIRKIAESIKINDLDAYLKGSA